MAETMIADSAVNIRELCSSDPVGIENLPEQIVKKRLKEGFVFNLMLIGETGIGKSTLASSLFNITRCASTESLANCAVSLDDKTYDLTEKGVNLKLMLVESVGYGDQVNRMDNVKPIVEYIEDQFEAYLREELESERCLPRYDDTRIHACLYFICPTGHNLKSLDIFCMKQLHDKVNLIPIVAKSDCLSKDELERFKRTIKTTLVNEGIAFYRFPVCDEEISDTNAAWNDVIPFAVAASEDFVTVEGELKRARIFPWGTMLVEDEEHSEFLALKRSLIEVNMEDMREATHAVFYEAYRSARLTDLGCEDFEGKPLSYQNLYENQQAKFLRDENKLREKYVEKVKRTEKELEMEMSAMRNKYDTLMEELKEEEQNIHRLRSELEFEVSSYGKHGDGK